MRVVRLVFVLGLASLTSVACTTEKNYFSTDEGRLSMDLQRISRLDFQVPEFGSYTVKLTDSGWVAYGQDSEIVYRADIGYLGFFLGEFNEPIIQRTIQNPADPSAYGFDPETQITIELHDFDVYLGRITLGSLDRQSEVAMSVFLRLDDDINIYSVRNMALTYFNRGVINWRDKSVLNIPRDSIKAVSYLQDGRAVKLERLAQNNWVHKDKPINYAVYNRLEIALNNLNAVDFESVINDRQPDFTMVVEQTSGLKHTLDFYREELRYIMCLEGNKIECPVLSMNFVYENLNRPDKY